MRWRVCFAFARETRWPQSDSIKRRCLSADLSKLVQITDILIFLSLSLTTQQTTLTIRAGWRSHLQRQQLNHRAAAERAARGIAPIAVDSGGGRGQSRRFAAHQQPISTRANRNAQTELVRNGATNIGPIGKFWSRRRWSRL